MTAEQNKMLVRRLVEEAVNPRNPDVLDEIAQGEFAVAAIPLGPALPRLLPRLHDADRRPGRRQRQSGCAFPLLQDPPGGWMGHPPTGRRFHDVDEIYIFRVRGGKLAAAFGVEDNMERMRQLGLAT